MTTTALHTEIHTHTHRHAHPLVTSPVCLMNLRRFGEGCDAEKTPSAGTASDGAAIRGSASRTHDTSTSVGEACAHTGRIHTHTRLTHSCTQSNGSAHSYRYTRQTRTQCSTLAWLAATVCLWLAHLPPPAHVAHTACLQLRHALSCTSCHT
jgi:hypothetical protein